VTTKVSKFRLPDEMLGRPERAPKRARAPRGSSRRPGGPSPFRQGLLLGICVGMTMALALGVVGFLVTRPRAAPQAAAPAASAPAADPATGKQPQASIDVAAEHVGDLQLRIDARVSAPGTYSPITKGQVVAYTDMVAMPMSHRQGPIVMAEVAGSPGTYQAVSQVPMIGEYNVTVEVRQPMAARADHRVDVKTVKKS
jgi:hypothetical protein